MRRVALVVAVVAVALPALVLAQVVTSGPGQASSAAYVRRSGDSVSGPVTFTKTSGDQLKLQQGAVAGWISPGFRAAIRGTTWPGNGSAAAFEFFNSGSGYVYGPRGFQFEGLAFASFPTCNAAAAKTLVWDTTGQVLRACDATSWGTVATREWSAGAGLLFSQSALMKALGTRLAHHRLQRAVATGAEWFLTCQVETSGGGVTAGPGTFTIAMLDNALSVVGSAITASCTDAVGTNYTATSTTATGLVGDELSIRTVMSGTCTTTAVVQCTMSIAK